MTDWNKRNGGFLDDIHVMNNQVSNLSQQIDKLKQELQRKDNNWNELKDYISRFLYMLNGILDRDIYEQCQLDDFTQIMDKIKELENSGSDE